MVKEDKFFKVTKEKYPEYDYSQSIFTKLSEPITVLCHKHGEFTKKHAFDLYNGRSGCPLCGKESRSLKNSLNASIRLEKAKKTNLSKYGVENPFQAEEIKEKIKQIHIDKYDGMGTGSKKIADKICKTKEERYGDPYFTNREKCKETVQERYGVDNVFELPETLEKTQKTNIEKYGIDCILKSKEFREKGEQTMLQRYGYTNYGKSEKSRNYIRSDEFKNTRRKSLHKNNTYAKSKSEDRCYDLLQSIFPNAIHHYTSDVYPFECDMYVPELDLYIECNFFWTHGGHFFDENNPEDLKTLEEWKSKHTKFYDIAIHVWTKSDIKKRDTAIKNNLNYLVFWTEQGFIDWINT